jgi:uncharacterized membrane protein YqaE (UPF0057 family)
MNNMDGRDLIVFLLTIVIPPVGVALKVGFGMHFWINLVLTLFGFYLPGLVHGLYVFFKLDT